MNEQSLPRLVTFDGEARSGKGTIVSATKDYLRDEEGQKVMLIDAGQIFRVLVIATQEAGVNLDNPEEIGSFLRSESNSEAAVQRVKEVYHLSKEERDDLLYKDTVSVDSAKIGAQPLSQDFTDGLLEKWMRDAGEEGFDTVLLDGRSLEIVGKSLAGKKLCHYVLGLYSICDELVGARRTRGFAHKPYEELSPDDQNGILELTEQIKSRNKKDQERAVRPLIRPNNTPLWNLADGDNPPQLNSNARPPIIMIDTSAEISREAMSAPVAKLVAGTLRAFDNENGLSAPKQFSVPANSYAS